MGLLNIFKGKKAKKEIQPSRELESKKTKPIKAEKKGKQISKEETAIKEKKGKKSKLVKGQENTGLAYRILIKPLVTEKATALSSNNQYVFQVSPQAKKPEIKAAVAKVYNVQPIQVNVCNFRGKTIRYGRVSGQKKKWRKAIITLKPGEKIETFEGV